MILICEHRITTIACLTLATVIFSTWLLAIRVKIWYCTRYLSGTCHAILITWYQTPVLDICHTCHLILTPGIWHMLILTWYAFMWYKYIDLTLWPLTRHYHPWYRIIWYIHDYHFYGDLIIILLPDIWYSWSPVILNFCILEPLKKGDSWYYTPVDPRNRITMNIG